MDRKISVYIDETAESLLRFYQSLKEKDDFSSTNFSSRLERKTFIMEYTKNDSVLKSMGADGILIIIARLQNRMFRVRLTRLSADPVRVCGSTSLASFWGCSEILLLALQLISARRGRDLEISYIDFDFKNSTFSRPRRNMIRYLFKLLPSSIGTHHGF